MTAEWYVFLPRILLFSLSCLYFLYGCPPILPAWLLANQHFIKIQLTGYKPLPHSILPPACPLRIMLPWCSSQHVQFYIDTYCTDTELDIMLSFSTQWHFPLPPLTSETCLEFYRGRESQYFCYQRSKLDSLFYSEDDHTYACDFLVCVILFLFFLVLTILLVCILLFVSYRINNWVSQWMI